MRHNRYYKEGHFIGLLLGRMESIITLVKNEHIIGNLDMLYTAYNISDDYYNEIKNIIDKYPSYNYEHLAKKVLFESTYRIFK